MNVWINGRRGRTLDHRDRGLQYGDGLFETMRVRRCAVRLLDFHLERLMNGCRRLQIAAPDERLLRREINRAALLRRDAVLKLTLTRGIGARGYRPSGRERSTRIVALSAVTAAAGAALPVRLLICATRLGSNPSLAGLKTLNRLESVLARSEWTDRDIREGLMMDGDENVVCGTMSNLFLQCGPHLVTPLLDRCGVAGVMRRWVMEQACGLGLTALERRIRLQDLADAEAVFISNAVAGVTPVSEIRLAGRSIRPPGTGAAMMLKARVDAL